jgi:hypothetical protein
MNGGSDISCRKYLFSLGIYLRRLHAIVANNDTHLYVSVHRTRLWVAKNATSEILAGAFKDAR